MSTLKFTNGGGESAVLGNSNGTGKYGVDSTTNGTGNGKAKSTSVDHSHSTFTPSPHFTKHEHIRDHQTCLSKVGNIVNPYTYEVVKESADYILSRTSHRPKIRIICVSELGKLNLN